MVIEIIINLIYLSNIWLRINPQDFWLTLLQLGIKVGLLMNGVSFQELILQPNRLRNKVRTLSSKKTLTI